MTCTPTALAEAARCYEDLPAGDISAIWIQLLCSWAEKDVENPQAPCQENIVLNFPGPTITLSWFNPIVYTAIEILHININTGQTHLEITLPGNATNWTTPVLAAGDNFIIRGVIGDDKSGFAYPGPCDGR